MLTPDLIKEICGYLEQGCTDIAVCRILGISHTTFQKWKRLGRAEEIEGQQQNPIYAEFVIGYEKAKGLREYAWIKAIGDPKWLISRHPDTKHDWAEIRYQKGEYSGSLSVEEAAERRKEINEQIDSDIEHVKRQVLGSVSGETETETSGEPEETDGSGSGE